MQYQVEIKQAGAMTLRSLDISSSRPVVSTLALDEERDTNWSNGSVSL